MSDLREAAQQAEIALTHMGQAAETLAEALRGALAQAQRLEAERDRLLVLLALLDCGHTPGCVAVPRARTTASLAHEFETWLVADMGLRHSSARVYRKRIQSLSARTRLAPERLAGLESASPAQTTRHERTALRRWQAFLAATSRAAA